MKKISAETPGFSINLEISDMYLLLPL